jgi:hypothetical protein
MILFFICLFILVVIISFMWATGIDRYKKDDFNDIEFP